MHQTRIELTCYGKRRRRLPRTVDSAGQNPKTTRHWPVHEADITKTLVFAATRRPRCIERPRMCTQPILTRLLWIRHSGTQRTAVEALYISLFRSGWTMARAQTRGLGFIFRFPLSSSRIATLHMKTRRPIPPIRVFQRGILSGYTKDLGMHRAIFTGQSRHSAHYRPAKHYAALCGAATTTVH